MFNSKWCKNKGLAVFALILLPVLLLLGNWQLQRADEKRAVLQRQKAREQREPLSLQRLTAEDDWSYLPVTLSGQFDQHHQFLLDNRVLHSQVGYEVLTPFQTDDGQWVIVNRGWVKAGRTRQDLPDIPKVAAAASGRAVKVVGEVYVQPRGSNWLVPPAPELDEVSWPLVVQRFDHEVISEALGQNVFAHQVRLREGYPAALERDWQTVNVKPEKHTAYAVQWFGMALALVVWYLFANTDLRQRLSKRQ